MRQLMPGFELDEENSEIRFADTEILSTCGDPPGEYIGIRFGESSGSIMGVPSFGSLGFSVLESGEWTRVAAVASTDLRAGIVRAGEDPDSHGGGNTVVILIDAKMPRYSAARAMVTATEAITAAMRELGLGCRGRASATGSEEQNIIVVTRKESPVTLSNAGKHSKLGELIGRTVKEAVLESARLNGTVAGIDHVADRLDIDIPSDRREDRDLEAALMAILQIRDETEWGFVPEKVGLKAVKDIASAFSDCDFSGCGSAEEVAEALANGWKKTG